MRLDSAPVQTKPETELGFRQGILLTYNAGTGANTVDIGGVTLTNLPLMANVQSSLVALDVVAVLRVKSQYFIMDKIVQP